MTTRNAIGALCRLPGLHDFQKYCPARFSALSVAVMVMLFPSLRLSAQFQTITRDKVQSYPQTLRGHALYTSNGGGHTAMPGDHAIDLTPQGGYLQGDGAFLNAAAINDEMTVALWVKKYDIANSSAFWIDSPTDARVFQVHTPYSDNVVYFDSSGGSRINAGIATFPDYTGDLGWWTNNWHFFVFSKKAGAKQIWIDGELFLEGDTALPLVTDINRLTIAAAPGGANQMHGLVDDFSIYAKALTESEITNLFAGTLPTALPASAGLLAYWDFNDYPPDGPFTSILPAPDATDADPNLIHVVHRDGATPWTSGNVSLRVDGVPVASTFAKVGDLATVRYVPNPLFAAQSRHRASLLYPDATGAQTTVEWKFDVGVYTQDRVQSRLGVLKESSTYSENAGGRTGNAGDYAIDLTRSGGGVAVNEASFLNAAATNDELTIALWIKRYDIANSSVFWVDSPTDGRVFQAHAPWSDNTIYFDTSAGSRINSSIFNFPGYTGELSWWTNNWRFFVFSKKAGAKQIWIDGSLFHEGFDATPLVTDIGRLAIGSDTGGGNRMHGLMDDFSIYSKALTETEITNLFTGTLPTVLPVSAGLLAYWDFNDIPPQGIFLNVLPTPDTTNAAPNLIRIVHLDGTTPWDTAKVSCRVDGLPVSASVSKAAGFVTASYVPSPIFALHSPHTAALLYDGLIAYEWQFTVGAYTKDVVRTNIGVLTGAAEFTPDGGGRSGNPGDSGLALGRADTGQGVHIADATFLNQAATNDEVAIVAWQKLFATVDSTLFFGASPTSGGNPGIRVYAPWSDNTLYFDTAGCCDLFTQRISAPIDTFPGYSGDVSWWTNWHHLVFQKKLSVKEIWIDGQLFLSGSSTDPLPQDFTEGWLALDPPANATRRGVIDDFAVFATALDTAAIGQLAAGTLPTALPPGTTLLAYWNFNDAPRATVPTINIAREGAMLKITFTGILQATTTLGGQWNDVQGATSPYSVTPTGSAFYRAKQ